MTNAAFIYLHLFSTGDEHSRHIVREILETCRRSGILGRVKETRCCIVGPDIEMVSNIVREYPGCVVYMSDPNGHHQFERFTLHRMFQDCQDMVNRTPHENPFVLYLHSKGSSKKSRHEPRVPAWRQAMVHMLTAYHDLCWDQLRCGTDAVGLFFRMGPMPHFSGNMWWSSARHVSTLPFPIGGSYLDPEMWIGKRFQWVTTLYNPVMNNYTQTPDLCSIVGSISIESHFLGPMTPHLVVMRTTRGITNLSAVKRVRAGYPDPVSCVWVWEDSPLTPQELLALPRPWVFSPEMFRVNPAPPGSPKRVFHLDTGENLDSRYYLESEMVYSSEHDAAANSISVSAVKKCIFGTRATGVFQDMTTRFHQRAFAHHSYPLNPSFFCEDPVPNRVKEIIFCLVGHQEPLILQENTTINVAP